MGNFFSYYYNRQNDFPNIGIDRKSKVLGKSVYLDVSPTPEKEQRVVEWFEKYYEKYFSDSACALENNRFRIFTIVRADIPIGWCRQCGFHITFHELVWCPECGLKEPLDLRDNYSPRYIPKNKSARVNKRHSI